MDTAMEIWECLYGAFSEGQLFLSPFASQRTRHNVEDYLKTLNPTPEQNERIQQLLNEFCYDVERRGFFTGMKIALRLYSE